MSTKRRSEYLDRKALGVAIEREFDRYVKNKFNLIKHYEARLRDETIAPWHRQMIYELSLLELRLDFHRALEVLEYVESDSLHKNERNLYRYFTEYQKLSDEVAGYTVGKVMQGDFCFSETELFEQVDEIYACSYDNSSLTNFCLRADEELGSSIDYELKDDGSIAIFVGANRTIEDIKWFIEHPLSREFAKRKKVNKYEKKLKKNLEGYTKNMLISFLLCNYVRPVQAVEYVERRLSELEESKKDANLNVLGKPTKNTRSASLDAAYLALTDNDINKLKSKILNIKNDWFVQAYQEYNEYFFREDISRRIQGSTMLTCKAMLQDNTNIPEPLKFLELTFDECQSPSFHVSCLL